MRSASVSRRKSRKASAWQALVPRCRSETKRVRYRFVPECCTSWMSVLISKNPDLKWFCFRLVTKDATPLTDAMDALRVKERLETALGARVTALAPMPLGFGLTGFKVDLADGRRLAVKARQASGRVDLRLEGYMLGELARDSTLPVPAVQLSEPDLLVMDFIETDGGGITPQVERHAAELIATLHAVPRPSFGYERDTLIGPLPQPNPQMDRWIPFCRDHRLLAMAGAAQAEGKLPAKLLMRLERLAERRDSYIA